MIVPDVPERGSSRRTITHRQMMRTDPAGAARRYDQAVPVSLGVGTGRQVDCTASRLRLDENHQRFRQNAIVLHGLGGSC